MTGGGDSDCCWLSGDLHTVEINECGDRGGDDW